MLIKIFTVALAIGLCAPAQAAGRWNETQYIICFGSGIDFQSAQRSIGACTAMLATPDAASRPTVLVQRARKYVAIGQIGLAIADLDSALAINPRNASALYVRGVAKTKMGHGPDGAIDKNAAAAIDPNIAKSEAGKTP